MIEEASERIANPKSVRGGVWSDTLESIVGVTRSLSEELEI